MALPLLPIGAAVLSGLGGILGSKRENQYEKDRQNRAFSGVDISKAIENAYAPWYGKGWMPGGSPTNPRSTVGQGMIGRLVGKVQDKAAGMNPPSTPTPGMGMGGPSGGPPSMDPTSLMEMLASMMKSGQFPR
jgi:hypothetical protein